MTDQAITSQRLAELRRQATSRLARGTSGAGAGADVSASGALAVLHDLASSPDTAADALALLHELQVHQVELDLQAEELRESRSELESALRRQIEIYDALAVGCITLDRGLAIIELNATAARMLGLGRDDVYGLPLDAFLSIPDARALRERVAGLAAGTARAAPTIELISKAESPHRVVAHASADPAGANCLLVLAPTDS